MLNPRIPCLPWQPDDSPANYSNMFEVRKAKVHVQCISNWFCQAGVPKANYVIQQAHHFADLNVLEVSPLLLHYLYSLYTYIYIYISARAGAEVSKD